jgi:lipopolysaccharide transport system ATP-binding protein
MSAPVISVENLSKRYLVGHRQERTGHYTALRDVISREFRNFARKVVDLARGRQVVQGDTVEEFWALKDICFEVKQGEVLGIVGRNGTGKSTLLKILSRITEPTSGRVILRGRVGSLLEVGTGFHPELSGRENIYLNGAILGMSRGEIRRKFDEIVAFAEVDRFLDTPVKRYSSGMYVRLAFAVAAHLDTEVLIVDEVLAVGDAEFQRKSLGKMSEVARGGRTVLFVSHNMQAIRSLTTRALLLEGGKVVVDAPTADTLRSYLETDNQIKNSIWSNCEGLGDHDARLQSISVYSKKRGALFSSESIMIELNICILKAKSGLCIGFDLITDDGTVILRSYDTDDPNEADHIREPGSYRLICEIPPGLLHGHRYWIAPRLGIHNQKWIVYCDPLISADVVLNHGKTQYWASINEQNRPGLLAPVLKWDSEALIDQFASK